MSEETYAAWLDRTLRLAKANGLTVKTIAAELGLNAVVLSMARRGSRNLSFEQLKFIAERVGVASPHFSSIGKLASARLQTTLAPKDDLATMKQIADLFAVLDVDSKMFMLQWLAKSVAGAED